MFRDEFNEIKFGDARLVARLYKIGDTLVSKPTSLVTTLYKTKGEREAAYRFLSNPKVVTNTMLKAHQDIVCERISQQKHPVLLIQDSTFLNYDKHPCTQNLGRIGAKRDNTNGLILHTSIAIDAHEESCLGIFDQFSFYHTDNAETDKKKLKQRNIQDKESYRWVHFLENATNFAPNAITICDRESDIFEFLHLACSKQAKIIVRQSQDRLIKTEVDDGDEESHITSTRIEAYFANQPTRDVYEIQVEEEKILLDLKYGLVNIEPTKRLKSEIKNSVGINIVKVRGMKADGTELNWSLMTTLPVNSVEEAKYIVHLYSKRWHIELFHKALKSGFGIEQSRLQDGTNIEKLIAIVSIIAAKLYSMMHLSRSQPDLEVIHVLDLTESEALQVLMKKSNVPSLQEAVHYIASHGGFQKTKRYPNPGVLTFWRGWSIISAQIEAIKLVWNR